MLWSGRSAISSAKCVSIMASGRHAGQCSDPGSLTGSQREMITGWVTALGLGPAGRARLVDRVTGHQGTSIDDLSEKQAGDVLEAMYERSRRR